MAEVDDSLECVQIDGLALLRIVKHCKENSPDAVTGTLLGLDVNRRLEITNAFPLPGVDGSDSSAYQEAMLKNLRSVNVDNNNVGWYLSSYMGSFYDQDFLDNQYSHQKVSSTSVVLVLDPLRTSSGRLALKAFRLSKAYMEAYSQKKHRDVKWNQGDVLEEVPIKVHNPHLVHGFLYDIRENKSMSCDADRLALAAPSVVERNLDFLMRAMDDYGQDQSKWQFYQRALTRQKAQQAAYIAKFKSENEARIAAGKDPLPEEDYSKHPLWKPLSTAKPSRLDSLLLSKQMQHQCSVVNTTATASFDKLYVIDALQKPK